MSFQGQHGHGEKFSRRRENLGEELLEPFILAGAVQDFEDLFHRELGEAVFLRLAGGQLHKRGFRFLGAEDFPLLGDHRFEVLLEGLIAAELQNYLQNFPQGKMDAPRLGRGRLCRCRRLELAV